MRGQRGAGWACRMSPRQLLIYRGAEGGPDEAPALPGTRGTPGPRPSPAWHMGCPRTMLPQLPFRDSGSGVGPTAWRSSGTLNGPPASRGALKPRTKTEELLWLVVRTRWTPHLLSSTPSPTWTAGSLLLRPGGTKPQRAPKETRRIRQPARPGHGCWGPDTSARKPPCPPRVISFP